MKTIHATECLFDVEDEWVDHTNYVYQAGEVKVLVAPFERSDTWRARFDAALERFRMSLPAFELVEQRMVDKPAYGAELVSMRVGGQTSLFELSIFWPLGDWVWIFRSSGPLAAEDAIREVAERFMETYQPVDAQEEP